MAKEPSFVLLSTKLPADTLALKLLGRIVEDIRQPTNGYRPENPRPLLAVEPIEATDTDATLYYHSVTDAHANAQLGRLLELSTITSTTDTAKLAGKKIITRILPQHRDAFDAIVRAHRDAVEKLLKFNDGVAYMIVGVKTIFDGSVEVEHARSRQADGRLELPVTRMAAAAGMQGLSTGLNLGKAVDPSIEAGRAATREWMARNEIVGEQVFAVQYRRVVLQREGRYLWSSKKTVQLKAMHVVDFGDGVLSDAGQVATPKEVVYEDDDSDDGEAEDDDLQGWAPALADTKLLGEEGASLGVTFVS
ncbi:uncharacterized protein BKA55DRAFT_571890 [Fusarium redolens]|uniref:Uncharacterized protein n=1 Tax=Fusarium redolens TaxID=48865 RepID=A0A9P9GZH1_FUSRE|nr:uncharacterized protein BKA55DRAFT_571890 [Fusarium redolens]KAH7247464.1 hypothetical protein BKA55DRAFT_571890 [Fusarium redolens]